MGSGLTFVLSETRYNQFYPNTPTNYANKTQLDPPFHRG
jgi:hypothetical protein